MHPNRSFHHYAVGDDGRITHIDQVHKNADKKFFCPYCNGEMIPKQGKIREWHFAHKADKCSYDKYLHSLAEKMLAEWFNNSESVFLILENYYKCNAWENCKFYDDSLCRRKATQQYDLKKYYLTAITEHRHAGFIADIYCDSDKYPAEPIFIEINVSHRCTAKKIQSGIRIIEIDINSEYDITKIINDKMLPEGEGIKLYNFKRNEIPVEYAIPFQKFMLYPSKKSFVDRSLTCRTYNLYRKGIFELSMPLRDEFTILLSGGFRTIGNALAHHKGYNISDCDLCFWQNGQVDIPICNLYKKCGNPKFCRDNDSSKCKMFRINHETIDRAQAELEIYAQRGWMIDLWEANKRD